jgi:hypothetical protein
MKLATLTKDHIEGAALVCLSQLEYDPNIEVYKLNNSFKVIISPVSAIMDEYSKFAEPFEFRILFNETTEKLYNYLEEAYEYCKSIEVEDNTTDLRKEH